MSIHAVSPTRHGSARWQRPNQYQFVATTTLAPLSAPEISAAALALPLALVQREDHWGLAAVLGLLPEQNLYVDGNGGWLATYIPAALRGYPFLIGAQPGGAPTLCVDEGSGLVTTGPEGDRFFDEDGQLAPMLGQITSFLTETARTEMILMQACDQLAAAGVVEVWPITVQTEGGAQTIPGLYRVNEAALNALRADAFEGLRRSGILALAYAQLLSTGHLGRLGQLAQARAQAEAAARAKAEVRPLLELPLDSNETWDWSKIGR